MTPLEAHRKLLGLCQERKFRPAIKLAEKVLRTHPGQRAFWHILGGAHAELGELGAAVSAFRNAIELDAGDAVAHYNLGVLLQRQNRSEQAVGHYTKAVALDPTHTQAHNNLGNILSRAGRFSEAIRAFENAIDANPKNIDARYNLASALREARDFGRAIALCRQIVQHQPGHAAALCLLLRMKTQICDFSAVSDFSQVKETLGINTSKVPPLSLLHLEDHPARHRLRAINWVQESYDPVAAQVRRSAPHERLRVGYFSTNFNEHPEIYLTAGLFRLHDKSKFDIIAYDLSPPRPHPLRDQLRSNVTAFHQVDKLSDREIAQVARGHDLDIAIDLNGYIKHSRTGLFAFRPAPVQAAFLGYPGTLGAEFFDYLIADKTVVPTDQREHFVEKIVFLPDTYQPTDDHRHIAQTTTTRRDFGLPEDVIVFCCFNASYKIGPAEFDIWMRIMARIDGSVLWLLKSNGYMQENLSREAERRGIAPDRLRYAERLPQAEHLARHKHADIFLDTFNYNAHTTASDALWAGLPVITKKGRQFASRVGASLLTAVGLPELIAGSEAEYERLVLDLAACPGRISELKARLARNRNTAPLFDTARYVRHFEAGLEQMQAKVTRGLPPGDIYLE